VDGERRCSDCWLASKILPPGSPKQPVAATKRTRRVRQRQDRRESPRTERLTLPKKNEKPSTQYAIESALSNMPGGDMDAVVGKKKNNGQYQRNGVTAAVPCRLYVIYGESRR